MTRTQDNAWLHRFAVATAVATFFLVWVGGLVTSRGAGMAVPDWPTTYGYNMFLFPVSKWTGGIFYEHSHRLIASGVGLLTVILAVWLWLKEERRWLRNLGATGVALVIGQGVLGGLRVTAMKDELGIFHATLAQLFFILICSIALFTSKWWLAMEGEKVIAGGSRQFRNVALGITILILLQLMLGASMRHQHAGLAIPDFPAAYGRVWPDTDAESVARYNRERGEVRATNPITATQIHLQMAHRIVAIFIVGGVAWIGIMAQRRFRRCTAVVRISRLLMALIAVQALLGAVTIWSNKAADIATAHVAIGALCFTTGSFLVLVGRRTLRDSVAAAPRTASAAMEQMDETALKA